MLRSHHRPRIDRSHDNLLASLPHGPRHRQIKWAGLLLKQHAFLVESKHTGTGTTACPQTPTDKKGRTWDFRKTRSSRAARRPTRTCRLPLFTYDAHWLSILSRYMAWIFLAARCSRSSHWKTARDRKRRRPRCPRKRRCTSVTAISSCLRLASIRFKTCLRVSPSVRTILATRSMRCVCAYILTRVHQQRDTPCTSATKLTRTTKPRTPARPPACGGGHIAEGDGQRAREKRGKSWSPCSSHGQAWSCTSFCPSRPARQARRKSVSPPHFFPSQRAVGSPSIDEKLPRPAAILGALRENPLPPTTVVARTVKGLAQDQVAQGKNKCCGVCRLEVQAPRITART